jgi:uncharacterized protein
MRIDKRFTIDAPQERVWQFVSSPERVGMCFPGCQEVTAVGDNKYKAAIKVQLGPIRTLFNLEFETTDEQPPNFSAYSTRGEEENRASRLKAQSTLKLSALDDRRTEVEYTSDVSIVGRLGKFGLNVMRKKADSMGDEFIQALRSKIEGQPERAATTERRTVKGVHWIIAVALATTIVILGFYFLTRRGPV